MDCEQATTRLNRIYRLYWLAVKNNKPHRIAKTKKLLQDNFMETWFECPFVEIQSIETLEEVAGPLPKLQRIKELKHKAITSGSYEEAAQLRDQELYLINHYTESLGLSRSNPFIWHNGKIYYYTYL